MKLGTIKKNKINGNSNTNHQKILMRNINKFSMLKLGWELIDAQSKWANILKVQKDWFKREFQFGLK